ncbi:ABC transporter ATP-binding protein [Caproiciproducens galactitolivorans]|uniref:Putative multidrug export ATP-binding/permease protein n=1 Tax=Caproiciproducens galactitolivorans TaxID=642589 RepID=A0A4Z0XZ18_9FIRM|nr:ABC transporter ATP-binding protein [Caproiciproducens galactitolivorans]QEY35819.1 ABC transporter ATP-binding protein [Caproiciproducens galactitolivorans]TGJ75757.1 putative multidrug export ATP-binding/permease protein [Caproiciproducens galactitolivorans]
MIKRLAPFVRKYWWATLLAPATIICEVLIEIRIPVLMAEIVDRGISSKDISYVVRTGGIMVIMALLSLLMGTVSARFSSVASMGFGSEIRAGLFEKVQEYSFSNVDKFSTASLVTRLTTDVSNVQMAFMMLIRIAVRAPIMLVGATFMAYYINSRLVTIFLVAIPVLAFMLFTIGIATFPKFQAMLRKYDAMNASVQENLISIRVVKAFVRSMHEKMKFKNANDGLMTASIKAERILQLNMPVMQLTMYACIVSIMWFGGNMVIVGGMKTGELIGFVSYVTQILIQLILLSMVFIQMIISRASASRIVEVLEERIDITDEGAEEGLKVKDGSICFEDVSFRYNRSAHENILKHINLDIKSGETIGIIGATGSAKSTLVQLIPRLYDATEGRVLVGGRDVRDYKIRELRDAVSMVLQKNVLFSGTIKENLKWGNENATDEQIVEACKAAQAHDFIMSFPDGYETDLGQGGVNVSGGQKQRLCIARALLKNPKILILDDSTSAVDTATDAKIREAFREKRRDITTIIIAQRITSVCDSDRIIVMNEGEISAVGTHEELLHTSEIYREVYESQQKGVDD